jgi:hypothetical protein
MQVRCANKQRDLFDINDPPIHRSSYPNRCSMLTYPTTKLRTPLSDLDGVLTYASRACASQ